MYTFDESTNTYQISEGIYLTEEKLFAMAEEATTRRILRGNSIESPEMTNKALKMCLQHKDRECFAVLFLNQGHKVIAFEVMFEGTLSAASVYPREVVKAALRHNAAAVIFCHNHPSGDTTPSDADRRITRRLKDALDYVDIRVLDHIIVGYEGTYSFAERGII